MANRRTKKKEIRKNGSRVRSKPARTGRGRKPGQWTLLEPSELLAFKKENNLTLTVLSGMLGVSVPTASSWSTGKTAPPPKVQERIRALIDGEVVLPSGQRSSRPRAPRVPAGTNRSPAVELERMAERLQALATEWRELQAAISRFVK